MGVPKYANYLLHIPVTERAEVPGALIRGGENADRCLLRPEERREIMEFEEANRRAVKVIKSANTAEDRLCNLMRQSYRTGCLGVDWGGNKESKVYGEKARVREDRLRERQRKAADRREFLGTIGSGTKRLGYNVFHHNESVLGPLDTNFIQTKNRSARVDPDTHSRLFSDRGIVVNPGRTMKLRNEQMRGKTWNITNGTEVEHMRSTVPYKVNRMQAHPSQASMERGGNKQGFLDLRHVERCTSPFLPP